MELLNMYNKIIDKRDSKIIGSNPECEELFKRAGSALKDALSHDEKEIIVVEDMSVAYDLSAFQCAEKAFNNQVGIKAEIFRMPPDPTQEDILECFTSSKCNYVSYRGLKVKFIF